MSYSCTARESVYFSNLKPNLVINPVYFSNLKPDLVINLHYFSLRSYV